MRGRDTRVISSWDNWWFEGGYCDRAFVDMLPLLALLRTSLFATVKLPAWRAVTAALPSFLLPSHVFQMIQY